MISLIVHINEREKNTRIRLSCQPKLDRLDNSLQFEACRAASLWLPTAIVHLKLIQPVGRNYPEKAEMHDTKERLSLYGIFALLNYQYADVLALFAFVGSPNSAPHLPQWALLGSAVLREIPFAMIVACRHFRLERAGLRIASRVAL
jgi:hypothetical protein